MAKSLDMYLFEWFEVIASGQFRHFKSIVAYDMLSRKTLSQCATDYCKSFLKKGCLWMKWFVVRNAVVKSCHCGERSF